MGGIFARACSSERKKAPTSKGTQLKSPVPTSGTSWKGPGTAEERKRAGGGDRRIGKALKQPSEETI